MLLHLAIPPGIWVGSISSYLNGVLPLGEVDLALPLLLSDEGGLVLGESSADGTGLLGSEVEREVLLVLVEQTQLSALVGVDDGQDTGDRLAEVVAAKEKKNLHVSLVLFPVISFFFHRSYRPFSVSLYSYLSGGD